MGRDERQSRFNQWRREEQVSKTSAYDRFGREIREGDVIHLIGKGDLFWRVAKVSPVLTPQAPPGMVEIHLTAAFITGVPGGQPIGDVIKCVDAQEAEEAKAQRVASGPIGAVES